MMPILTLTLQGKDKSIGGGGQYAIWLYGRKRDNRCSFYSKKNVREIQGEG